MRCAPVAWLTLSQLLLSTTWATQVLIYERHDDRLCGSTNTVEFFPSESACEPVQCFDQHRLTCSADYATSIDLAFAPRQSVLLEVYDDQECTQLNGGYAYPIDGQCHKDNAQSFGMTATAYANSMISIKIYSAPDCSGEPFLTVERSTEQMTQSAACEDELRIRFLGGKDTPDPPSETPSSPTWTVPPSDSHATDEFEVVVFNEFDGCRQASGMVFWPAVANEECKAHSCFGATQLSCSTDYSNTAKALFETQDVFVVQQTADAQCQEGKGGYAMPVDGHCHSIPPLGVSARISPRPGGILVTYYGEAECSGYPGKSNGYTYEELEQGICRNGVKTQILRGWGASSNAPQPSPDYTFLGYHPQLDGCATADVFLFQQTTECVENACATNVSRHCTANYSEFLLETIQSDDVLLLGLLDTDECSLTPLKGVAMRMDGKCHSMALGESGQVTVSTTGSIEFRYYEQAECVGESSFFITASRQEAIAGHCVGEYMIHLLENNKNSTTPISVEKSLASPHAMFFPLLHAGLLLLGMQVL